MPVLGRRGPLGLSRRRPRDRTATPEGVDLGLLGFDESEIDRLLTDTNDEAADRRSPRAAGRAGGLGAIAFVLVENRFAAIPLAILSVLAVHFVM